MGTHTDFTGAIRIRPCLEKTLASNLDDFLSIRHVKRSVAALDRIYTDESERKALSLFSDGNFGADGEFFLPIVTKDLCLKTNLSFPTVEGIEDVYSMNTAPGECPSLYCDLMLVSSEKDNCSYLGWNEAEKAYHISDWLEYLAKQLVPRGYHLDGKIFACVEGGMSFYSIIVQDEHVMVEEIVPDYTYQEEYYELL